MSEKQRDKKQGASKNKKNERTRDVVAPDRKQNADAPGVHNEKRGPDQFDQDRKKSG